MAIYTVKEMVKALQDYYNPDDLLVATWWSKEDVELYLEEMNDYNGTAEDLWNEAAEAADRTLEDYVVDVNQAIADFVLDYEEEENA